MLLRSFFLLCLLSKISCAQEVYIVKDLVSAKNLNNREKISKIDFTIETLRKNNCSVKKEIQHYISWLQNNKQYEKVNVVVTTELKEKKNLIDSVYTQNLYYNLGLSKYNLKQFDTSISFFQSGLKFANDNIIAGNIYFNLGKCYHKKGDYYQSIKHYKLSQLLHIKYNNWNQLFKSYINITLPYNKLKKKDSYLKSRAYFYKADSLIPYTSIGKKYDYVVKVGLGDTYNTTETLNIPKASLYYKEALGITKKNNDSFHTGMIYSRLGNLHDITDPDLGIKYQKKRLPYISKNDSLLYAITYNNIGSCYDTNMLYDQSINYYKMAINYLINNSNDDWVQQLKENLKLLNKSNLLKNLKDIASSFLKKYKLDNSKKSLQESINNLLLADQLINLILLESQERQSKLFWREQSAELYGKAIEACYLAKDAEKAFYFMEKNKALLLNQDLKSQQLKQSLNLPDSILKKEIELKKRIYHLKHLNSSNKDSINIAVLGIEYDLKKLQDSIQQKFKNYKSINFNTDIIELSELQNTIDPNEAVLTYNISQYDDYSLITPENKYTPVIPNCKYGLKTFHPAYGLLITKNHVEFFKLANADQLKNKVQNLIQLMRKPFETEKGSQIYNKHATELYNILLPSKKLQNLIKNKKIRIIPDNYLHYLPFEALITKNTPEKTYWIQENEISYGYSNTFLNNIKKQKNDEPVSFVGFSPVNFNSQKLSTLPNSFTEINSVSTFFSGTSYTHEKATKQQFFKTLPNYDIIHLATHADAQDSVAPWIAFKKEKLILDELATTTNKAKMVVLSGCNTLLGEQKIGEGIMSLARGFFQSGAKSVVSSLWNVDDQSTASIMIDFYENLKEGETKSKALQNAKINYLKKHTISEASPYYWSSFVLLGNTKPLINSSSFNLWLLLFLLPISFLVYLLIKKYTKH